MPIEIRELVIKATIGNSNDSQSEPHADASSGTASLDEERIIKKVVEKVMELIKMRRDR
ncbi:MAG: DUF5908 family protein [Bacteroidia bacterium]